MDVEWTPGVSGRWRPGPGSPFVLVVWHRRTRPRFEPTDYVVAREFRKAVETLEYSPGEAVPVTSVLYRVAHDPPEKKEELQTFYSGDSFPPCPRCGKKVRYLIPIRVIRQKILKQADTD